MNRLILPPVIETPCRSLTAETGLSDGKIGVPSLTTSSPDAAAPSVSRAPAPRRMANVANLRKDNETYSNMSVAHQWIVAADGWPVPLTQKPLES
jgi:hypothetical protein